MQLVLSPAAQDDSADVLLYTLQTWGEAQEEKYAAQLDKGLSVIAENPSIGRPRPELAAQCRSYRVQHHIIYYAHEGKPFTLPVCYMFVWMQNGICPDVEICMSVLFRNDHL